MFRGAITALVTPFADGELDKKALERHINWQISQGIDGLLPCGTTGETPSLTEDEQDMVISTAIRLAKEKKIPVIAGAGTNSTAKTVKAVKRVAGLGADAALVVTPYYNKPTQEGLYCHYAEICEKTDFPVVIYNVPSRTGGNILPETVQRLSAKYKRIVAVKEASGKLDQATDIVRRCGDKVAVLSGDDSLTLPLLSVGGKGVISVVSNIVPYDMANMVRFFEQGDLGAALTLHQKLYPLMKALFVETNPGPVKAACGVLGINSGDLRLPLAPVTEENFERIRLAIGKYGIQV
ncbi:4-hydroxy-tetrahydrodipicolinate synthase [candidate division WOR-3 bacterium]|uniref:4-hydroxy-tetrahydrodipicolinate synthase n=1 Tax=candidate division WOR-3 bacterium TaxID=2052148 RepID=A0A9D5QC44_UNCW3|nr:4-hydroxy-tetrahydrodipicolinate synthase [candidate division WOR-3 bacterium]MBD3363657.1 4-hydroxy-tetrahydrodipicolinate synthase [candidate division WOR-3 bacterium]